MKKLFPIRALPRKAGNKLRQSSAVHSLLTPLGKELTPERWIFIIGCYNSGTTLVEHILSSHPEIGGLPLEGVALTDSLSMPEAYGWTRMWSQCIDEIRMEPGPGMAERARRIKRQWSIWYPHDTPNLVEKSIANAARIPFLQAYFRPAYFIYIVRNGYAVAEGIRRKADLARWKNPEYSTQYPIELCAQQWHITDEIVGRDRRNVGRFITIYYEDLADAPKATLNQVFDFIGLRPFSAEDLDREWNIHGVESPIKNMNDQSIRGLSKEDIYRIERVANETLIKHGYKSPEAAPMGDAGGAP